LPPGYPDGAAILAQLQSIKSEFWKTTNTTVPDYRDFPGLPIRTRTTMTKQSQPTKPGGQLWVRHGDNDYDHLRESESDQRR